MRAWITSSESCALARSRRSRSGIDGGNTKMLTRSRLARSRSCCVPCQSISNSTSISPRRAIASACRWLPLAVICSFQILHLLAELLDHALELQPDIRQLHVVRFRAERVGFAIELLCEKIEPTADRAAVGQQP